MKVRVTLRLEGDGFEPSALYPESSVSTAFRASVAANLHPYAAPFCTPLATEIPQPKIIPSRMTFLIKRGVRRIGLALK